MSAGNSCKCGHRPYPCFAQVQLATAQGQIKALNEEAMKLSADLFDAHLEIQRLNRALEASPRSPVAVTGTSKEVIPQ